MRLGRIQNDYYGGFEVAKAQGMEFIEICCNNDNETEALISAREVAKQGIERTGVAVSCVGRWSHQLNENGAINEDKLARYMALLDTAVYLGAKTFVCGCNYDNSITLFQNYKNAIYMFDRLIKHADGRIKVAVQNCDCSNFVVSPKHWEIILGELPDLYIKFDASHAYNRRENYLDQLADWCDRIAHIHVKGTVHAGKRLLDDPPAGMDDIQWGSMFAILYAKKYTGDLSIEPHSDTWNGELGNAGIIFTRDFIRHYMI